MVTYGNFQIFRKTLKIVNSARHVFWYVQAQLFLRDVNWIFLMLRIITVSVQDIARESYVAGCATSTTA